MPGPKALVTDIADIIDDPANPGVNTIFTVIVKFLFMGPVPMEQQIDVSVANTATKSQLKTAIDNAIIVAAAGLGSVISVSNILTIADIAG